MERWKKEDVEDKSNNLTTFEEAFFCTFLDTKKLPLCCKISRIFFAASKASDEAEKVF